MQRFTRIFKQSEARLSWSSDPPLKFPAAQNPQKPSFYAGQAFAKKWFEKTGKNGFQICRNKTCGRWWFVTMFLNICFTLQDWGGGNDLSLKSMLFNWVVQPPISKWLASKMLYICLSPCFSFAKIICLKKQRAKYGGFYLCNLCIYIIRAKHIIYASFLWGMNCHELQ